MTFCQCCGGGGGGGGEDICLCRCCSGAIPRKFQVVITNTMEPDASFDWCSDEPAPEVNDCQIAGTYELDLQPCSGGPSPSDFTCIWQYNFPTPHGICAPHSVIIMLHCEDNYVSLDLTVCWNPVTGFIDISGNCLRWNITNFGPFDGTLEKMNCMGFSATAVPVWDPPGDFDYWQGPSVPCGPFIAGPAHITSIL